jgi:hypothetical protein
MEVLNSFNLYVDSEDLTNGRGDDFVVPLANAGITAGDGQFIRLSMESFNCYKNFYNVNANNNKFRWFYNGGTTAYSFTIPSKNYKTIGDIASAFFTAFTASLVAQLGGTSVASLVLPSTSELMDDTSDRLWGATITNSVSTTGIVLQSYSGDGESFALCGGDRVEEQTDNTTQTFSLVRTSGTVYTIQSRYPAQRSTEEHLYLRCDATNNNLEMAGLSMGVMPTNKNSILNSDILMKCPIDFEFVNFTTGTGQEFQLNLTNKNLTSLHFYITDSKGRPLGRALGTNSSTTLGTKQNTLGNLNCSFVIKVELIQAYEPNKLITEPPPYNPIFARKSGVLTNMNFGRGAY